MNEQQQLERLARRLERQLTFLRHSPREERGIPFEDLRPTPSLGEAWLGAIVFFALIAFFILSPWIFS